MIELKSNVEFFVLYNDGTWEQKTLKNLLVGISYEAPEFTGNDYITSYKTELRLYDEIEEQYFEDLVKTNSNVVGVKISRIAWGGC